MGEPIIQVPIPLKHPADDDIAAMEEKIHQVEHKAIVDGVQIAIGRLWKEREQGRS